jgi:glycogen operon protein
MPSGEDISDSINEMLQVGETLEIEPRSVMILVGISKI